jgi:hypothetical protein
VSDHTVLATKTVTRVSRWSRMIGQARESEKDAYGKDDDDKRAASLGGSACNMQ